MRFSQYSHLEQRIVTEQVDCAVIGAGVVGLAIARELAISGREVIVLVKLSGLSHAEAARRLGRTEGSTRVLLSRALARLATRLEEGALSEPPRRPA